VTGTTTRGVRYQKERNTKKKEANIGNQAISGGKPVAKKEIRDQPATKKGASNSNKGNEGSITARGID